VFSEIFTGHDPGKMIYLEAEFFDIAVKKIDRQ
jgi:hypothetical protein